MRNLKRLVIIMAILMVAIFTTNCKKDTTNPSDGNTYELKFNINSISQNGGYKSTTSDTILCSPLTADYVMYKLNSEPLTRIDVFYDQSGVPFTNSIKRTEGSYTLKEFLVYSDNNTPANTADDILIMAAPHVGSTFAGYSGTPPLDRTFTINVDLKAPISVDVLCFQPQYFTKFGFAYFQMNELTLRQLWFFGDFCIKDKADYAGSLYSQQTNWGSGGGFIDAPAIAKVEVWRNGVLQNTFINSKQGEKISVNYGDYKLTADNFEIKLFILVKQGTTFTYNFFKSWTFTDISNIPQGTDGVIDYVLGNCYDPLTPPDLILSPWMNLPLTATYKATTATLGGYVDANLSNIPAWYDITNGVFASNCADHNTSITMGQNYNVSVYSSLQQQTLPAWAQSTKWAKINWLYNHLDYFPGYHWYDIQGAIWLFDNPAWNGQALTTVPALTPIMTNMKNQMDLYGVNYRVPPAGWAAIIFIYNPTASNPTIQTMFIKVDP